LIRQKASVICFLFLSAALLNPAFAWAQLADGENEPETTEESKEELAENPGGAEDDSYDHPETLAHRSGYKNRAVFASTANTVNQLEEDDRVKDPIIRFAGIDRGLQGWFDMKRRLNEESGIKFGFDYNSLYQSASDSLTGNDSAWSGVFRLRGVWDLVNKGEDHTGSLVFGVETRHNISYRISPASLAGEIGYIGLTGTLFSEVDGILGNLYYQQQLGKDNRAGMIIGRFDPNDFMDVLGYANPWTTFSNLAVLLNTSIALPDWSWGLGAGTWLTDQWYLKGSINDANGSITNESFFSGGAEFFTHAEIGWSPSRAERYSTNIHLTAWHVDEREDAAVPSSYGFALGANKTWNQTWMVFSRLGWSDGTAPIANKTASLGFGRMIRQWSDVFGLSVAWEQISTKSLPDQSAAFAESAVDSQFAIPQRSCFEP
jgi:porin